MRGWSWAPPALRRAEERYVELVHQGLRTRPQLDEWTVLLDLVSRAEDQIALTPA
jgi:hypothetical protein